MRELDTEVAEAAERWLNRPGDVEAYGHLVAAVARRRHERLGAELAERGRRRVGDDGPQRSTEPTVTASPHGYAHGSRRVSSHDLETGDPQARPPVPLATSGPASRPGWRLPAAELPSPGSPSAAYPFPPSSPSPTSTPSSPPTNTSSVAASTAPSSGSTPSGPSGPATPVTSYGRPGPASYPVLDALPPTAHGVPDPTRRDHETTVIDLRRGPSGSLHLPDDPDMPPILAEMMRAQGGRPQGQR